MLCLEALHGAIILVIAIRTLEYADKEVYSWNEKDPVK